MNSLSHPSSVAANQQGRVDRRNLFDALWAFCPWAFRLFFLAKENGMIYNRRSKPARPLHESPNVAGIFLPFFPDQKGGRA
jgi:hypothetical protein